MMNTEGPALFSLSVLLSVYYSLRKCNTIEFPALQKECKWMDQDSFNVMVAMCDAFIPHHESEDISESALFSCFDQYGSGLFDKMSLSDVLKRKPFFMLGSLDQKVPERAVVFADTHLSAEEKFKLVLMLKVLSTSVGCAAITGKFGAFHHLSLEDRINSLQTLRDSFIGDFRAGYMAFKRLTAVMFLGILKEGEKENESWKHLEYEAYTAIGKPFVSTDRFAVPTTLPKVPLPPSIASIDPASPSTADDVIIMHADVVVVGSGAGGGIMASELVKAGLKVVVLEKGGYYTETDFARWAELEGGSNTMEQGGLCCSDDGNINIFAGSCVGGGSTINWSASFKTPENVRKEWAIDLPQFRDGGDFENSLDAVCKLLNVNSNFSFREDGNVKHDDDPNFTVNTNNRLLWAGGKKLGLDPQRVPRNVKHCVDCGNCPIGCSYRSKQSTITALLEPLANNSSMKEPNEQLLHIIPNCKVDKVLFERLDDGSAQRQVAVGVAGSFTMYPEDNIGQQRKPALATKSIRVMAKVVVSSAGSLQTPALLLRSKLAHPKIGKHLTLHPVLGVEGYFPNVTTGLSSGVGMGVIIKPDQNRLPITNPTKRAIANVAIETPPVHLSFLSIFLPWSNPISYKAHMLNQKHLACFINLPRDESQESNCVTINGAGDPSVRYNITSKDVTTMMCAMEAQTRLMRAAGATIIAPMSENGKWFTTSGNVKEDNVKFESFLQTMLSQGLPKFSMPIFSAHQMSSCRMAASPDKGPIQPTGETWECRNLYVADGSVLPSSLGVNPMITIEALAHMISRHVMQRLSVSPLPLRSSEDSDPNSW